MTNKTMMQYFEWYLPDNQLHWKRCDSQVKDLADAGVTMVWLPPAYKGASGGQSVGYDVYDTYDLGEFDQKGSVGTKYGKRDDYLKCVHTYQENGIEVLTDIVLNHRMGADGTEVVKVQEQQQDNRNANVGETTEIEAWTKFDFPGRKDKYSDFHWNASHFSGTDYDEKTKKKGVFQFDGKKWSNDTDLEKGNFDYLMGADVDSDLPVVAEENIKWGKWYMDTVHMDGFRLDAVKHISFEAYRKWIIAMQEHQKEMEQPDKKLFIVGEYFSRDVNALTYYLNATEHSLTLFDVPLHFNFLEAGTSDGKFDMAKIFDNTLLLKDGDYAVTFVDNHDTQPGQALSSFIPQWFKPIAYALILLRAYGTPCVFYGDYYGIPHCNIPPVVGLRRLIKIRQLYAYGEEKCYFDDCNVIGFTRAGDDQHPNSGLAVLVTDSIGGKKRMEVGKKFAKCKFMDAMGRNQSVVEIGDDGWGEFFVDDGSVSVWVPQSVYENIYVNY